jgi:hypothetical protein
MHEQKKKIHGGREWRERKKYIHFQKFGSQILKPALDGLGIHLRVIGVGCDQHDSSFIHTGLKKNM